jgi:hypothetical protein
VQLPARLIRGRGVDVENETQYPKCLRCDAGVLLPLSDYGRDGAPIRYKAWVCSNPECGFNIRIDNGEISFGRGITQSFK